MKVWPRRLDGLKKNNNNCNKNAALTFIRCSPKCSTPRKHSRNWTSSAPFRVYKFGLFCVWSLCFSAPERSPLHSSAPSLTAPVLMTDVPFPPHFPPLCYIALLSVNCSWHSLRFSSVYPHCVLSLSPPPPSCTKMVNSVCQNTLTFVCF